MSNSLSHKHLVGGLHISYEIDKSLPSANHSYLVDQKCIFGIYGENHKPIIETCSETGNTYISNLQLYNGASYSNIHSYIQNIHTEIRSNKEYLDDAYTSLKSYTYVNIGKLNTSYTNLKTYVTNRSGYLNNGYNWLRKYVLDAYTYSYNTYNNLYNYVTNTYEAIKTSYEAVKTSYANLNAYTSSNITRLDNKVNGLLESKDALVFRGTVKPGTSSSTSANSTFTKVSSDSSLITSAGSTFKVTETGYFFTKKVFAGSIIISNKDNADINNLSDWILIDTHVGNLSVAPENENPNDFYYVSNVSLLQDGTLTYTFNRPFNKLSTSKLNNGKKEITYTSYANVVTGVKLDTDGKLTYSFSDFYIDAVNKAEMSEYAKLSDLSEFAKGAYGLTELKSNSNAGNVILTNLYLDNSGYLTYDYTSLSASKNSGGNHDLENGSITVVTGISQGGNGKITYHYTNISDSNTHKHSSDDLTDGINTGTGITSSAATYTQGKAVYEFVNTNYAPKSHNHTSANLTDGIKVGTGITSSAATYTQGKAVYEFVNANYAPKSHNHTTSQITDISTYYKPKQTAISNPLSSNSYLNSFINGITQNENGVISPTRAYIPLIVNTNIVFNASGTATGTSNPITTAQFIEILTAVGAFNAKFGIFRGSWSYAGNDYINDTGCGNIQLAGSTVEVIGSSTNYTIRIHTPSTSGGNSCDTMETFIYCFNGTNYHPTWVRLSKVGHTHTSANLTDGIKVGTGITSSAATYTQGKAVYEFVNTNYAPKSHNHDDIYYTETETNNTFVKKIDLNKSGISSRSRNQITNIAFINGVLSYSYYTGVGLQSSTIDTAEIFNDYGGHNAQAPYSHAEGLSNTILAAAEWSHAEGSGNVVEGKAAHAEGSFNEARGNRSHVGGLYSTANYPYAFAHGFVTYAKAASSGVIGDHLTAYTRGEFAVGTYNLSASNSYMFTVGGGNSSTNRKNLLAVSIAGKTYSYFYGDMHGTAARSHSVSVTTTNTTSTTPHYLVSINNHAESIRYGQTLRTNANLLFVPSTNTLSTSTTYVGNLGSSSKAWKTTYTEVVYTKFSYGKFVGNLEGGVKITSKANNQEYPLVLIDKSVSSVTGTTTYNLAGENDCILHYNPAKNALTVTYSYTKVVSYSGSMLSQGRFHATTYQSKCMQKTFAPVSSVKTTTGDWSIGHTTSIEGENLSFIWSPDTSAHGSTNADIIHAYLPKKSGKIALLSDIPQSIPTNNVPVENVFVENQIINNISIYYNFGALNLTYSCIDIWGSLD